MSDESITGEIVPHGAPMGRPSGFSEEIAGEICDRLSAGESLIEICEDDHMPAETTVYRWLRHVDRDKFRQDYASARENQADHMADEMKLISDDGRNDWMEKRDAAGLLVGWTVNGEHVSRSKMRWEDRRWRAGKLRPKKYGDKSEVHHTGTVAQPTVALSDDPNEAARQYRDFIAGLSEE